MACPLLRKGYHNNRLLQANVSVLTVAHSFLRERRKRTITNSQHVSFRSQKICNVYYGTAGLRIQNVKLRENSWTNTRYENDD